MAAAAFVSGLVAMFAVLILRRAPPAGDKRL